MQADRIKNWPLSERPRERLVKEGPERLSEAELLAIVLRVGRGTFKRGVRGETALTLARSLLKDFRGLQGLDRADLGELMKVQGLNTAKVAQIKAAFELGKRLRTNVRRRLPFNSATDVADYLRPRLAGAPRETVVALFLDGQNNLLDEKIVADGTPIQATVYVRRVLEEALRACSVAIVLAHNHPSGSAEPSPADDETTRDLARGADTLGLHLTDHVIIGEPCHFSYADSGRLESLREL